MTKLKPVKLVVLLLVLALAISFFIIWWLFIAIAPNVHSQCGAEIVLSRGKPEVDDKHVVPLRLVSIDYENRRACIEAYAYEKDRTCARKYKKGWNKFCLTEGQAILGFYLVEVYPNRVKVIAMYAGFKRGRPLRQLWEFW